MTQQLNWITWLRYFWVCFTKSSNNCV